MMGRRFPLAQQQFDGRLLRGWCGECTSMLSSILVRSRLTERHSLSEKLMLHNLARLMRWRATSGNDRCCLCEALAIRVHTLADISSEALAC